MMRPASRIELHMTEGTLAIGTAGIRRWNAEQHGVLHAARVNHREKPEAAALYKQRYEVQHGAGRPGAQAGNGSKPGSITSGPGSSGSRARLLGCVIEPP
jgi:hypothetical protein